MFALGLCQSFKFILDSSDLAQQLGAVMGPIVGGAMTAYFSYKFIIGMSGFICLPLVLYLFLKRPAKTEGTGTPLV